MNIFPAHPLDVDSATSPGGIVLLDDDRMGLIAGVFDPWTMEPRAWREVSPDFITPTPDDESLSLSPTTLLVRGYLFNLFPGQTWYLGRPWEGVVDLTAIRRESQQASGTLEICRQTLYWNAKVNYTPEGQRWSYSLSGWPTSVISPLDVLWQARVSEALHGLVMGEEDSVQCPLTNLFTAPLPYLEPDFLVDDINIWLKYARRTGAL